MNDYKQTPFVTLLTLITGLGLILRIGVIVAMPDFYGPGDPSLYYSMATSIVEGHGVEVGFLRHYWTWPEAVVHQEDFYEPLYAALLACFLIVIGKNVISVKLIALIVGTISIPLTGLVARRLSNWKAGLWAAAMVSLHPYSIYYSGLIMKEILVGFLLLLLWDWASRVFEEDQVRVLKALGVGAAAGLIGVLQYESMPILVVGLFGVLLIYRRKESLPVLGGMLLLWLPLLVVTWLTLKVPISAKFSYFLGLDENLPEKAKGFTVMTLFRLIPPYHTPADIAKNLEVSFILLAGWQFWRTRNTIRAKLFFGLFVAYLYFHSVPDNLWTRDFLTVTPRLAVFSGIALDALLIRIAASKPSLTAKRTAPAVLLLLIGVFHLYTGYGEVYRNPEFPGYEFTRMRRESVCRELAGMPEGVQFMTDEFVEEIWLYTGHPVVRIPDPYEYELMKDIIQRYRISHFLLAAFTPSHDWRPIVRELPVKSVRMIGDLDRGRYFLVELDEKAWDLP